MAELFQHGGRLSRALCAAIQTALCDSRPSVAPAAGLFAALASLLSDPRQLEAAPVVMGTQMFPAIGTARAVATQAGAASRTQGAAARPQEPPAPLFSTHGATVDVLPEGCEDAEPFLSMHVVQTLQVLLCALGGLRQLRLLPDEVERACGDACQACVQVLEGVYSESDKLCAAPSATPPQQ